MRPARSAPSTLRGALGQPPGDAIGARQFLDDMRSAFYFDSITPKSRPPLSGPDRLPANADRAPAARDGQRSAKAEREKRLVEGLKVGLSMAEIAGRDGIGVRIREPAWRRSRRPSPKAVPARLQSRTPPRTGRRRSTRLADWLPRLGRAGRAGRRLGESKKAPHLLENTRNRVGNGRPHELDPGMRLLSWRPGLAATPGTETRRSILNSLDLGAAAMWGVIS